MKFFKCDICGKEDELKELNSIKFNDDEFDICGECFFELCEDFYFKTKSYKDNEGTLKDLIKKYNIVESYIKQEDLQLKENDYYITQDQDKNLLIFSSMPMWVEELRNWICITGSSKLTEIPELASDYETSTFHYKAKGD